MKLLEKMAHTAAIETDCNWYDYAAGYEAGFRAAREMAIAEFTNKNKLRSTFLKRLQKIGDEEV